MADTLVEPGHGPRIGRSDSDRGQPGPVGCNVLGGDKKTRRLKISGYVRSPRLSPQNGGGAPSPTAVPGGRCAGSTPIPDRGTGVHGIAVALFLRGLTTHRTCGTTLPHSHMPTRRFDTATMLNPGPKAARLPRERARVVRALQLRQGSCRLAVSTSMDETTRTLLNHYPNG